MQTLDKIQEDLIEEIQRRFQKTEAEAKLLGLVMVRVSKRRCIVAKISGSDGGFWHAGQVFGPATEDECVAYITDQRRPAEQREL